MHNTALTFFQTMNKKPQFFSIFTLFTIKKENILNNSQDTFKKSRSNKSINMTKIKTDNIYTCLTLDLDQFINFLEKRFHP